MPLIAAPLPLHAARKDSAIVAAAELRQGRIAAGEKETALLTDFLL